MQRYVPRFVPEVWMSHYKLFKCDSCRKMLSTRTLSNLGINTFRHNNLTVNLGLLCSRIKLLILDSLSSDFWLFI